MSVPDDARKVYTFLVNVVLPRQTVATYQEMHQQTGVMFGPEGGYIGQVLG